MQLSGWRYPVVVDLQGLQIGRQRRPILLDHQRDVDFVMGQTDSVAVMNDQLIVAGHIMGDSPKARQVIALADKGFAWQASIGARAEQVEFVPEGKTSQANGREFAGPVNVVRRATLGEISFVVLGADENTSAQIAAGAKNMSEHTAPEPMTVTHASDVTPTEALARARAERQRLTAIRALVEEAASYPHADIEALERIAAQAESEGWSAQQTELAILRATRPRAPQIRSAKAPTKEVLEAALCLSLGIHDEVLARDRDYGPAVVERAWPLRRSGLRGIIAQALQASGHHAPHGGMDLYRTVLDVQAAGGFSTMSIPGILSGAANKLLLNAFTAIQATYPIIAEQRDFANFHQHDIYRLDHLGEFARVPPDGELKHGRLAETAYANKLETYGQMLTLPRQSIINDDLGAFESLVSLLARKARLAAEKALYLQVCENTDNFYTVARNNRHINNPLGIQGLATAEAAMLGQADADGDPIYAMPRYLLVPPALRWLADTIYTSATIQTTTTTDRGRPVDNPFRGRFEVVSSPYLQASTIPGSSSTTWYLVADPALLPAWQIAYLDGRRAPTIETADAEFNTLGLAMRAYWDFGIARIDYRGVSKSTP
jgi:hypothetical protein